VPGSDLASNLAQTFEALGSTMLVPLSAPSFVDHVNTTESEVMFVTKTRTGRPPPLNPDEKSGILKFTHMTTTRTDQGEHADRLEDSPHHGVGLKLISHCASPIATTMRLTAEDC